MTACRTTASGHGPTALSQGCHVAVIVLSGGCRPHDSAGLLHQAMDPRWCHSTVMWLSFCCPHDSAGLLHQAMDPRWCHSTVMWLSFCCPQDSAGLLHQAMDPRWCHSTVMWLSLCCQEAVFIDSVQDYCIRPCTNGTIMGLSLCCQERTCQFRWYGCFPRCRGAPPGAVLGVRLEGRGQVAERFVEAGRLVEGVARALPQRLQGRQRLAVLPAAGRATVASGPGLRQQ
jgi:hypothetical protein